MPLSTPVAFFIFKRPDVTQRVFDSIAKARPQQLFLIGDGPREEVPDEAERVAQTRELVAKVDWDCDVRTDFSLKNLGCKQRVVSGMRWVFEQVEEAIILEDDCLPDPTFYRFCEKLLSRYRDDRRIVGINGNNFQAGQTRTPYSYYYSKYFHCWGWATWRRVWEDYDADLSAWPDFLESDQLSHCCDSVEEEIFWRSVFSRQFREKTNSWAYAWTFSCWLQSGLSVAPEVNLVTNLGFGDEATHTSAVSSPLSGIPTLPIEEISHPPHIVRHKLADACTFKNNFLEGRAGLRKFFWRLRNIRKQRRERAAA